MWIANRAKDCIYEKLFKQIFPNELFAGFKLLQFQNKYYILKYYIEVNLIYFFAEE